MEQCLLEAETLLEKLEVVAAKKVLDEAIANSSIGASGHLDALGLLARCQCILGKPDFAIAALDGIVAHVGSNEELAASYAMCWAVRASLHSRAGRRREALRDAVAAFQNGGDEFEDEQAALAWGDRFVEQMAEDAVTARGEERAREVAVSQEANDDSPNSAAQLMNVAFGRATQFMDENDFNGAEGFLTEAISLSGATTDGELTSVCLSTRAYCRIMLGMFDLANRDLTGVINASTEIAPDCPDRSAIIGPTLVARAVLHRIRADMERSKADLDEATIAHGVPNAGQQVQDLFDAWTNEPAVQKAMQTSTASAPTQEDIFDSLDQESDGAALIDESQATVTWPPGHLCQVRPKQSLPAIQALARARQQRHRYGQVQAACRVIQAAVRGGVERRRHVGYSEAQKGIANNIDFSGKFAVLESELAEEMARRMQCELQIRQLQEELSSRAADTPTAELQATEDQLGRAAELGQSLLARNDALQNENADLKVEKDQFSSVIEEHEYRVSEVERDVEQLQERLVAKDAQIFESEQSIAEQAHQLSEVQCRCNRAERRLESLKQTDVDGGGDESHDSGTGEVISPGRQQRQAEATAAQAQVESQAAALRAREEEVTELRLAHSLTEKARVEAQRQLRQLEQRLRSAEQVVQQQEAQLGETAANLHSARQRGDAERATAVTEQQRAAQLRLRLHDVEAELLIATGRSAVTTPTNGDRTGAAATSAGPADGAAAEAEVGVEAEYRSLMDDIASPSTMGEMPGGESLKLVLAPKLPAAARTVSGESPRSAHQQLERLTRKCSNLTAELQQTAAGRDAVTADRDRRLVQQQCRELAASRKQAELLSELQQHRRDNRELRAVCEQLRTKGQQQQAEWRRQLRAQAEELKNAGAAITALKRAQGSAETARILSKVTNNPLLLLKPAIPKHRESPIHF
jgi:hypothetical protein